MIKLSIVRTRRFKRSFKRISKRNNFNRKEFENILETISNFKSLDPKYKDHQLKGDLKDFRECHIKADLLLTYQILENELVLLLLNIGNHSDLF